MAARRCGCLAGRPEETPARPSRVLRRAAQLTPGAAGMMEVRDQVAVRIRLTSRLSGSAPWTAAAAPSAVISGCKTHVTFALKAELSQR